MNNSDMLLTTEKLNDKAYIEIKNRIISRELEPGMRLVDSQLADKYGISRTPVRDAIRKLAEEGLVVPNAKKGYYVFNPTRQDIVEIYELRLIMDKAIITKIITEMLPSNYTFYEKTIQQIEENLISGINKGAKHFMQYDETFHDALIRLSNNSRIISVYDSNRVQTKMFRFKTSSNADRIEKANRLHIELIQAVKNMDLDNALRCVCEHVDLSRKDALADLNGEE